MQQTDPFLMFIIYAAAFIVGILITRAIFSIPKLLRYQRTQTKLLALIAEKHGVDTAELKKSLHYADESFIYGDLMFNDLKEAVK